MSNKIKIGDRVQLKAKQLTWHVDHLVECFEVGSGSKKLLPENWEDIAILLGAKHKRTKLKGTAINYGAPDDYATKKKRNFVNVEFTWKGLKTSFYCSEDDLKKL